MSILGIGMQGEKVQTCTNGILPTRQPVTVASSRSRTDTCPFTKFEGGLQLLHKAEDLAVKWLESIATTTLVN